MENLTDVLKDQIRDLYSAETQMVEAIPKMIKAASSSSLKKALEKHLIETKEQVNRLKKAGKSIGAKINGHVCEAMKGLIKEAGNTLSEKYKEPALKDVMIDAAAQRVEHYEMAGYGCALAIAEHLGLEEVCRLLGKTDVEEVHANDTLFMIFENELLPACEFEGEDDENEDENEELSAVGEEDVEGL